MSLRSPKVLAGSVAAWVVLLSPAAAQVPLSDTGLVQPAVAAEQQADSTAETAATVTVDLSGYRNGELPDDLLCSLSFASAQRLQCDAAAALEELNDAYRAEFGVDLRLTDSYRSFDAQVAANEAKPELTADPGYSNHGWGLAIDVTGGGDQFGTAEHEWLVEHAPEYGWGHPMWASESGSRPEAWHFEYGSADEMEGPAPSVDVTVTLGASGPPPS